jgi:hypothetical protein
MKNTIAAPLYPSTHPVGVLSDEDQDSLDSSCSLALDGILSTGQFIAHAIRLTDARWDDGTINRNQADEIVAWARSF